MKFGRVVLVALLLVGVVGCISMERREQLGGGMQRVGTFLGTAGGVVPTPWTPFAVAGGAILTALGTALKGRRDTKRVGDAIREVSKLIDMAKSSQSGDTDLIQGTTVLLNWIDENKDLADPKLAKLFALYDQYRKGLK